MTIGIDCSRYALPNPTGVEHYTNHIVEGIIEHTSKFKDHQLRFYVRTEEQLKKLTTKLKKTNTPSLLEKERGPGSEVCLVLGTRFWTIYHLSKELFFNKVDLLFVPSHTFPLFIPKKSLITIHGIEAFQIPKEYTKKQLKDQLRHIKRATKNATKIIAVSNNVKESLVKYANCDNKKIDVIYNGYENVKTTSIPNSQFLIPNSSYILSIGRLEPRKNQLRLIQALEKIADKFPKLNLILAGPITPQSKSIIRYISKSKYKDRIQTLGHTTPEQTATLMKNAKLFAFPSLSEGFGIPLLEAMNAATPILTSKGSGCDEIAKNAALHINPYDTDDIAKGLKKLLTDETLRKKLIRSGKARVKNFSWEKCIDQTIETILSLTNTLPTIIIRGPLAVGKTTIAKALAIKLKAEYISFDKILSDNNLDKAEEGKGIPLKNFIKGNEIALKMEEKNTPAIFDGCFYHKAQMKNLMNRIQNAQVFTLKAPLKTCIERDKKRDKSYGVGATTAVYNLVSKFDYGTIIETENRSAEETTNEILSQLH